MHDFDDEFDGRPLDAICDSTPEIDASSIQFSIPASVLDRLVDYASMRIVQDLQTRIDKVLRQRIDEAVTETFDRSVAEIAENAVADFLNKPRQKTNTWGEPLPGSATTMAELIPAKVESWLSEHVDSDGKPARGFESNKRPTRFHHILDKHVRDALKAETKAAADRVTDEAKKVVAASVGRFIAEKLVPQIDVTKGA